MRSRGFPFRAALVLAAVAAPALVGSCARQGAPPGGPEDRRPPVVAATRPDTFAVLERLGGPIRIVFNERISERPSDGTLDDAVVVSPRIGDVVVEHGRRELKVEMTGGFPTGMVFRVTVLPVIRDMFGNAMRDPFEFAFSTGGDFNRNAAAGLILDRTTGETLQGVEVQLEPLGEGGERPDTAREDGARAVYVARTDTSGIFAFRFIPAGTYRLVAFEDRDRDREADPFERQGDRIVTVDVADTLLTDVPILEPDTTPARLAAVEMEDSAALRLEFDDFLDPLQSTAQVEVVLEADTAPAPEPPGILRVFHVRDYAAWRDSVAEAARPDSAVGDSAAGLDPEAREAAGRREIQRRAEAARGAGGPGGEPRTLPDGTLLPDRELVVALDGALPPDVEYRVTVDGVVNINNLRGGGGESTVVREAPPEPDSAATDSLGAATDTTGSPTAPPDTAAMDPDTTGAEPDTSAALPDSSAVDPDTTAVDPDTTAADPDTTTAPPDTTTAPAGRRVRVLRHPVLLDHRPP